MKTGTAANVMINLIIIFTINYSVCKKSKNSENPLKLETLYLGG